MNSANDPKAVGPRIRMMMPQLTPLEARVVETVFGLRNFSDDTALKDLAAEAGVSEAMVVKITKKLGFSGVEIGIRRLEARPTATLCVDCKTLAELKEKQLGG